MPLRKRERAAIASRQEFRLPMTATTPNRTDGVDDEASRKQKAGRDPHISRRAPHARSHLRELPARRQQVRTRCSVYRAIDTTAAKHPFVRRIDDDVNGLRGDVTQNDLQARRHRLPSNARLTLRMSRAPHEIVGRGIFPRFGRQVIFYAARRS